VAKTLVDQEEALRLLQKELKIMEQYWRKVEKVVVMVGLHCFVKMNWSIKELLSRNRLSNKDLFIMKVLDSRESEMQDNAKSR